MINIDIGYLHKVEDFQWIKGAKEAIKLLNKKNFKVIVVTNQSGVGRGFYKEKDIISLHSWMNEILIKNDSFIDDFFYSTEIPNNSELSRRKPSPKMIEEAIKKYNLDHDQCFLVGDKNTDLEAAKKAKIKGFLFDGKNLLVTIKKILKDLNF